MKYDVCVIGGGGHIGLPLSIALADKGKKTVIYDINENVLEIINSGRMPFIEEGAEERLRSVLGHTLTTSASIEIVSQAKFVIVIIGTPVDEHLNPKYLEMKKLFESIASHLHSGQIVVLRSTVYPGLTAKIRSLLRKHIPDIEVCYCPERIAEGKAMEELQSLPQIISGFCDNTIAEVEGLFLNLTRDIVIISPVEAELSKLFTNSWRYIQFAAANQFYMLAESYGLDFYKIYDAMTFNYPRTKGFPKPGFAAGPCLFKDTMQLSAFSNNKFFLGHSAMLVNEGLPNFIVEQLRLHAEISEMAIGILGMAFKGESDDKRESLSYKLRKILEIEAREVYCSDPYVCDATFLSIEELIDRCAIIIIGAPHRVYESLDFRGRQLVDVWNITGAHGLIKD